MHFRFGWPSVSIGLVTFLIRSMGSWEKFWAKSGIFRNPSNFGELYLRAQWIFFSKFQKILKGLCLNFITSPKRKKTGTWCKSYSRFKIWKNRKNRFHIPTISSVGNSGTSIWVMLFTFPCHTQIDCHFHPFENPAKLLAFPAFQKMNPVSLRGSQ